jgi:hypothetical protein
MYGSQIRVGMACHCEAHWHDDSTLLVCTLVIGTVRMQCMRGAVLVLRADAGSSCNPDPPLTWPAHRT